MWARKAGYGFLAIELADAIIALALVDIGGNAVIGVILVAFGSDRISRVLGLPFLMLSVLSTVLAIDAWALVRDAWREAKKP